MSIDLSFATYILSPQHGFVYELPKVKGSRFVGIVFQISSKDQILSHIDAVQQRYPDATHRCYAYKIGQLEKVSDDGEPSGTAGKPILSAIHQSGYDTILVIVVRYFGGTMLGAGGLVRAYGKCARELLSHAPREEKELLETISLSCSYDDMPIVMQCIDKFQGRIISQDAGVLLQIVCEINQGFVAEFSDVICSQSGGRIEMV